MTSVPNNRQIHSQQENIVHRPNQVAKPRDTTLYPNPDTMEPVGKIRPMELLNTMQPAIYNQSLFEHVSWIIVILKATI